MESSLKGYSERHHVVPKCLGGGDDEENLVYLSGGDHLFAHLLLGRIYGGKLWIAYFLMSNTRRKKGIGKRGRALYSKAREEASKSMSELAIADGWFKGEKNPMLGRFGADHPGFGRSPSAEEREKASQRFLKRIAEEGHPMLGRFGEKNHLSRAVLQIDPKTAKVVKTHGSLREAARNMGLKSHRGISAVLNGFDGKDRRLTAGGYKWEYVEKAL